MIPSVPLVTQWYHFVLFFHWLFPRSPINLPDDNGVTSFPFSYWLFPRFSAPSWS